jgi:hypothetical protein
MGAMRRMQGCARRINLVIFQQPGPSEAVQERVQGGVQTGVHTRGVAISRKGFD